MQKRKTKIAIIIIITIIFAILIMANKVYATETDITSNFVDENLRNSILELAKEATGEENKTKIYESDIDKIVTMAGGSSLKLANKGIQDLSGIEVFSNKEITWIFLDWNEITDLTPLANFDDLTKISFSGNKVTDLTPLANLTNLTNIIAINNKITTIEPLKNLQNIKYICLDGNNITTINTLQNWTNLEEISFQNNQIQEMPNLSALTKLKNINVSNNKIQTINTIGKLDVLEKLEIDNNLLTSLEGIQNLLTLRVLSCSNNQITQIAGLEQLANLENLNMNKNQLQNIASLQQNTQMQYLYLDNNSIQDFDVLQALENLKKYSVYNQNIAIEIKEKLVGEYALIPLPKLYNSLYDESLAIHQENITTQVTGTEEYEIDSSKQNIKLKIADLKNNDIKIEVKDETNMLLNYYIQVDRTAPKIEGITNNQNYFAAITPICQDDDISEVILTKDGQIVEYELGIEIIEKGKYTLTIEDRAGNETSINFEIKNEIDEGEEYKIEEQYITNISNNTTLDNFIENLNGNVSYKVYREEQLVEANQIVATGDKLVTEYGKIFYLIVTGDITKDGNTNIKDLVKMRRNLLKIENFDKFQIKAADVANDNTINIKDLVQIRKMLLRQ